MQPISRTCGIFLLRQKGGLLIFKKLNSQQLKHYLTQIADQLNFNVITEIRATRCHPNKNVINRTNKVTAELNIFFNTKLLLAKTWL